MTGLYCEAHKISEKEDSEDKKRMRSNAYILQSLLDR